MPDAYDVNAARKNLSFLIPIGLLLISRNWLPIYMSYAGSYPPILFLAFFLCGSVFPLSYLFIKSAQTVYRCDSGIWRFLGAV